LSHVVVDDLTDLGSWAARAPDGSVSTAILIGPGPGTRIGSATMRIQAVPGALGHRVEREHDAVDLSSLDDLELWVRGDRTADGSAASPFFLELRLGSEAIPVGSTANDWNRLIPITVTNAWQAVPLALDDLAPGVRSGVTQIRMTCIDADAAFALDLDQLIAIRPELLADVDAALVARLGAAAPAVVLPVETEPAQPFFRITSYGVRPAPERSPASGFRSDFTGQGFSIRPPSTPFDLLYAVDAVSADRADAARLLEHVYAELTPVAVLEAAGRPLTIESVDGPQLARTEIPGQPTVYLKVSTAQRATGAREPAVPPFNSIDVEADTRAVA
jgi:hypothetical protein